MSYARSLENGAEDLGELFTEQIAHLTSSHLEFFARWFHLLAEEEQFCRVTRGNSPWLSSALERYVESRFHRGGNQLLRQTSEYPFPLFNA